MTDDFDFDDFDDLDDSSADNQAQAVERFQQQVSKKIKLLMTRKAPTEKRVEAALWLGEAGDPKAITALSKVYKGEKNKEVKGAVEYALGMFKALDLAIEREEGESVNDALYREENKVILGLLTNIALKGEFGKRRQGGILTRLTFLLMVSLVILVVLNVVLLSGDDESDGGDNNETIISQLGQSNTGDPTLDTLADLQIMTDAMQADGTEIQTQLTDFDPSAGGVPANCAFNFNRPSTYEISDPSVVDPATQNGFFINGLFVRVNTQVDILESAQATFDGVCDTVTPDDNPTQEDIDGTLTNLEGLLTELDSIESGIAQLQSTIQPVVTETNTPEVIEVTEEPTEELEPTEIPTITPTPAPDASVYRSYVFAMNNIINEVTEPRQALDRLEQAWADVAASGTTGACDSPAPIIPDDYTDLPDDIAQQIPELADAQEQLNGIGLTLLRNGWDLFTQSCQQGTLGQNVTTGQTMAETARGGFNNARNSLNSLP